MSRLPTVGGDSGSWGTVLNDYLSVPRLATFARAGTLTVVAGAGRFPIPFPITITGVVASVGTAPTGQSILCDVNKNGTTIFTTQANRPEIHAGDFATLAATVPDVTSAVAGDYLSSDVDQVGSGTAGADLVVHVMYLPA